MSAMHEIEYKIYGDDMQFVEVELDPNEAFNRIDDPRLQKAIPLDFNGRVVIDAAKREFYPADIEAGPKVDTRKLAPIGVDKVRKFEVTGDRLVVTYQDAAGKPTARTTWRRRAA